jgi:Na+/melibiose symporter-like transporter
MAVLISATSVVALRTGFLPKWLAWAGLVAALVAVLKFLVPHATLALLWIVVSLLMIGGSVVSPSTIGSRRLERSS